MHIADFSVGMLGANGVVAAGIPIATGAAHALKIRAPHLVACFFGDGAATAALPRRPELGQGVRPAGAVRLRGQPHLGHHAHRADDGR